jgi:N-acetylglutamate synthase-like GNAT family acetyltransferase
MDDLEKYPYARLFTTELDRECSNTRNDRGEDGQPNRDVVIFYLDSQDTDQRPYWVARSGSDVVGCVGLEHGNVASLLRSAAVHPDHQNQGIGDLLATTAISEARGRGDQSLYLFSTDAGGYWQRYGFVEVDVWTLADALPDSPQVRSGIEREWIADERAWKLDL